MLNTWQYTKGYVRIEAKGFNTERFLNMAAFHGIYLWDVQRTPSGIQMNVSIQGFKLLKNCARKTKCRTKIIRKHGVPFIMHRYRKRKILGLGMIFFIAGLITLSSFVWYIDIEGHETLPVETITAFLASEGLHLGALKFRLDDQALQQSLLNGFQEVSWADVHTRGTRTTVLISEAIPQQDIIDRQTPSHVVAAADGLITSIVTASGAPLVRQNDVVRQGEILVSGLLELVSEMDGSVRQVHVHSYAEIWARRYHPIEFSVPLNYAEKIYTGETIQRHAIQLLFAGERRFNLPSMGRIPFESYDKITTHHQLGVDGDYPLPFVHVITHYSEFTWAQRTRTHDEARALAERMITNRILREFDFAIDIIDRRTTFEETADSLRVSTLITTHERIDQQVEIPVY